MKVPISTPSTVLSTATTMANWTAMRVPYKVREYTSMPTESVPNQNLEFGLSRAAPTVVVGEKCASAGANRQMATMMITGRNAPMIVSILRAVLLPRIVAPGCAAGGCAVCN
jgi:hypothetical protein